MGAGPLTRASGPDGVPTRALRIAIIAHNRFPIRQPFPGGLESYVWYLVRALAARGHSVTLFAAPHSDLGAADAPFDVDVRPIGTKIRPQWQAPVPDHRDYLALMRTLIDDGGASFDVVHNHAYHYWPILLAARLRVPMLTTLHTAPVLWLKSAIRASGGRGSRFASVSESAAELWRDVVDDVMVVNGGVRVSDWPAGPGGSHLVWFGRITPEKGPHAAIDAARRAGMPLRLAGPIYDERYFRRKVRPHLGGDVTYVGHLGQPQLAELVGGAAAALITPCWDEAFGLVVAEAMSCGTPVIAFDRGAIRHLVTPDVGRVVAPGDTAAMAAAVADVATLSRDRVRSHAVTHTSDDASIERYLGIYRSLIEEGPSSSPTDGSPSLPRFFATLGRTAVADGIAGVARRLAQVR
ncbi:glycosyl transferase family 1 [Mycolicibacterium madagascariense]|uniref:Glycosyl transferase family 1 n=1 Tax=Mycolicibacterium madagascariense TaxID=212765 RepID=A0A7I7XB76_9MYCO|nr:glycosyltransferase [Mycolicibacterium madagascariense]MCV7012910.1 glycosyltransferase [Mycolicibacterium madagascariense]BBZ26157.1 glycosyl transferase family 1 [Mycolicibacterium madagascariense]